MEDIPKEVLDMLYTKPGIGSCARRRLRKRLGLQSSNRSGNTRRKIRVLRDIAFERQGGLCFYCEVPMVQPEEGLDKPNMVTADHLLPKADGGADVECNVVAACLRCNNAKGHMPLIDFKRRITQC